MLQFLIFFTIGLVVSIFVTNAIRQKRQMSEKLPKHNDKFCFLVVADTQHKPLEEERTAVIKALSKHGVIVYNPAIDEDLSRIHAGEPPKYRENSSGIVHITVREKDWEVSVIINGNVIARTRPHILTDIDVMAKILPDINVMADMIAPAVCAILK